jgi:hypothetical protein
LEVSGDLAEAHAEARKRLLTKGIAPEQADSLARSIYYLIEDPKTSIASSTPNITYQNSRPANMALGALMPFSEQDRPISFYRDVLILGATYQPAPGEKP